MRFISPINGRVLIRRIAFVGVVALAVWITWELSGSRQRAEKPPEPVPAAARAPAPSSFPPLRRTPVPAALEAEVDEDAPPAKLDPKSEEFYEWRDERLPRELYATAASCYEGGANRKEKLKVTYHAQVVNGEVSLTDVQLMVSTLTDKKLEACMLDALRKARWRADEVPDWAGEDELLIRIMGTKKFVHTSDSD